MPKNQEVMVPVSEIRKVLQELLALHDNADARRRTEQSYPSSHKAMYSAAAVTHARMTGYLVSIEIVRSRFMKYLGTEPTKIEDQPFFEEQVPPSPPFHKE